MDYTSSQYPSVCINAICYVDVLNNKVSLNKYKTGVMCTEFMCGLMEEIKWHLISGSESVWCTSHSYGNRQFALVLCCLSSRV